MSKSKIGFWGVFCISAGTMISSGLFVLPGIAYSIAGSSILISYLCAAILMLPTIFSKAELVTAMPKSGGSYFFVERSLGAFPGMLAGVCGWSSILLKASFALVGFGGVITLITPNADEWMVKGIALVSCLILGGINAYSVKHTGRFQIILVAALLVILAYFCFVTSFHVDAKNFSTLFSSDKHSIFAVAGMVFISFGGITKVIDISGEVENVHKNIPRGIFLAFIVVTFIYIIAIAVTVGVLSPEELTGSLAPLSLAAKRSIGIGGEVLVTIASLFAFITTGNAGILAASRYPEAMSKDGLLPSFFLHKGDAYKPPLVSIIFTVFCMMMVILFFSIANLIKVASTMMLCMFIMQNFSVIVMRETNFQSYRPLFKAPLYPWFQISAILCYVFLIIEMGFIPLTVTFCFAIAACLWYLAYVHYRVKRKSALMTLMNRTFFNDIKRNDFEGELRKMSLESIGVSLDWFDEVIQASPVVSFPGEYSISGIFRAIAHQLIDYVQEPEDVLYDLLEKLEREGSLVIKNDICIAFLTVSGENVFKALFVKVEEGVRISSKHHAIRAFFIVVKSSDQKKQYVESLVAITNITQGKDFIKRWREAYNDEQIRDVLMLSRLSRKGKSIFKKEEN
jgi:basic amino acid/polyamine antiporter, APA family